MGIIGMNKNVDILLKKKLTYHADSKQISISRAWTKELRFYEEGMMRLGKGGAAPPKVQIFCYIFFSYFLIYNKITSSYLTMSWHITL